MRANFRIERAKVSILVKLLLIVFFLLPLLQIGATRGESLSLKPSDIANSSKPEPEITIEVKYAEYIPPKPPVRAVAAPRFCNRSFTWGNCTDGVSRLVCVPWSGHAIQWPANARAMGYKTGLTPRVGAIYVSRENSFYGHTALVTAVYSNGSYLIREMNNSALGGLGIFNNRVVYPGTMPVVAFIYR